MNSQHQEHQEPPGEAGAGSASTQQHRAQAAASVGPVACAVLTVSDTRSLAEDRGGALIVQLLQSARHSVIERGLVRDDVEAIRGWALQVLEGPAEVLLVTGGSGIGPRDVSPEALRPLLASEMPGFGEVFRLLSWGEVGAATMLSRAFAGVIESARRGHDQEHEARRTLLFVLPGSTNAVRLAMEKLIVPELSHLVGEARGRS